jgi:hypothetical protein
MAASAARTIGVSARPALSLRVPSVEEAWPVVMGLKVLGMATLVAGVVTWRIAAQLLAGVGAPTILGSVFALGAFAAGFALYALALLVQAAVGSAHDGGEAAAVRRRGPNQCNRAGQDRFNERRARPGWPHDLLAGRRRILRDLPRAAAAVSGAACNALGCGRGRGAGGCAGGAVRTPQDAPVSIVWGSK